MLVRNKNLRCAIAQHAMLNNSRSPPIRLHIAISAYHDDSAVSRTPDPRQAQKLAWIRTRPLRVLSETVDTYCAAHGLLVALLVVPSRGCPCTWKSPCPAHSSAADGFGYVRARLATIINLPAELVHPYALAPRVELPSRCRAAGHHRGSAESLADRPEHNLLPVSPAPMPTVHHSIFLLIV